MAKRFQRRSSSFTQFVEQALSGDLLRIVSLYYPLKYFSNAEKLPVDVYRWFSGTGHGQRAAAPRRCHAIIKTLITAFQTEEQPEYTDRGGDDGAESRHLSLASDVTNENMGGRRWAGPS